VQRVIPICDTEYMRCQANSHRCYFDAFFNTFEEVIASLDKVGGRGGVSWLWYMLWKNFLKKSKKLILALDGVPGLTKADQLFMRNL
jgi:hypothetical protein